MSMSKKQGLVDRPGIVLIVPMIGYTNPAPTLARTSRTGRVNPVGTPLTLLFCQRRSKGSDRDGVETSSEGGAGEDKEWGKMLTWDRRRGSDESWQCRQEEIRSQAPRSGESACSPARST
eukprot:747837-Hanusia_phi.AAC.2